jgi:mannose-6-phosphate isomerase-like protein (cupin superfamily)
MVSEEDNGGARQLYRVQPPPWRPSPPRHYHLAFSETFTVIEGQLDLYLGSARRHVVLSPGESVTAAMGELHTFANERSRPSIITVETKPAGGVVKAFRLAYGVANQGGAGPDGLPRNPLTRLLFIRISEGFLPNVPLLLQRLVLNTADAVAGMSGLKKCLAKYLA